MTTNTLITRRLVLRPPVAGDAPAFMAYSGSARYVRERGPQTEPQRWSYFAGLLGHWTIRGFGRFMATRRDTGAIVGHVGPLYPDGWPEREIAWHLWSDADEGQGFAHEAAQAALRHAFGSLGWATAVSYIGADNSRSRRLAERLGAVLDPLAPRLSGLPGGLVYRHRPSAGGA